MISLFPKYLYLHKLNTVKPRMCQSFSPQPITKHLAIFSFMKFYAEMKLSYLIIISIPSVFQVVDITISNCGQFKMHEGYSGKLFPEKN
jgi:hypothetical protein